MQSVVRLFMQHVIEHVIQHTTDRKTLQAAQANARMHAAQPKPEEVLSMVHLMRTLSRSATFWLVFWTFALGTGVGLFVINNLGSMVEALNGGMPLTQWLVRTLSLCNCLGRPLAGFLVDHFRTCPRGTFITGFLLGLYTYGLCGYGLYSYGLSSQCSARPMVDYG